MAIDSAIKTGYKQTELGLIPNDWDITPLGKLCNYQNGTALESYFNDRDGLSVISIGNYSESGKFVETGSYISREYLGKLKKFVLNKNDLTMILNDKTAVGTIIGRVLYIDKNEKYIFNQRTMRLTVKEEIDPLFLYFQINSAKTHKYIINLSKPGTQIYVNTNDITNLPIIYPKSKPEQTSIATVLSDTDALIEHLEKLIDKKKVVKQGTMQQLLTGKKRLPGFSGEWENKKLGDIFTITAGGDLDANRFSLIKDEKYCYPIYSNALTNKGLYGFTSEYKQMENTITVTARGQVGFAIPRHHKYCAIGRVLMLNPLINLDIEFIAEYINNYINFSNENTGVPQLTAPQISKYSLLFPSSKEQTAIATILSDMDTEIESLEEKRDKYVMIKQGMMQQLLTGKIRIYANN